LQAETDNDQLAFAFLFFQLRFGIETDGVDVALNGQSVSY
jgi:hypothetical protein